MSNGDRNDQEGLFPDSDERDRMIVLAYDELRDIANRSMAREGQGHTLQATSLVHEVFLRLAEDRGSTWTDRRHFFAAVIEAMRRILIEHARRAKSQKRGGQALRVTLGPDDAPIDLDLDRAIAVHEALDLLRSEDERAAEVARLRFLVGLSVGETATALSLSERTVHREWAYARARLFEMLGV